MATRHQQESLTALYQSIKYCEELGLPCNDIYKALGHLEDELRQERIERMNGKYIINKETNKQELDKIESVLY